MNTGKLKDDQCFILVKAQPHRSSRYFETVCCAGIGLDGNWRRQYPVPFRILNNSQKFRRWDWIKYQYVLPEDDKRRESQKVIPESLEVGSQVPKKERAKFISPLLRSSFSEANSIGESLTLIQPRSISISYKPKNATELKSEEEKHKDLAAQMSLFDNTAKPLKPCPVQFHLKWQDQEGKTRNHECDDWETSTAYSRFLRSYGHDRAIDILRSKYEDEYFKAGLALAFSTHSRRNSTYGIENQWLLVGILRVEVAGTSDLFLG